MSNYLDKDILNDIENKIEKLRTLFKSKYNITETFLRNIEVNDILNNKVLHFNFPWESYKYVTNKIDEPTKFISLSDDCFICHKADDVGKCIGYKYDETFDYFYYKNDNSINNNRNYIRYRLPIDFGKVILVEKENIFYPYIKIKDNEYKLLEYNKKTWVDNEIPYLQCIDNIEEGINNVAEILYKPPEYEYKEWTTTGYYNIGTNDYGLAQKPISERDFQRWNKNIELLESIIDSFFNIWNVVSYINWNEENEYEWEEF